MASLSIESRPALHDPVVVAAFAGWNDGGSAATLAAAALRQTLELKRFAVIDPDDYVDFQQTRPRVSLRDNMTREISWPETEFLHGRLPGAGRDLILICGVEPNLRWKAFCGEIVGLCSELDVQLAITLGGLLADTPHTRPVPVSGSTHNMALARRLGLSRSRYEGPTGIVGALHDAFGVRGIPSATLWAAVPHYISGTSNPKAALALLQRLGPLLDVEFEPGDLSTAAVLFERHVAEAIARDSEMTSYVRELEAGHDDDDEDDEGEAPEAPRPLPTGEELADELQRFLRDHRPEGEQPGA